METPPTRHVQHAQWFSRIITFLKVNNPTNSFQIALRARLRDTMPAYTEFFQWNESHCSIRYSSDTNDAPVQVLQNYRTMKISLEYLFVRPDIILQVTVFFISRNVEMYQGALKSFLAQPTTPKSCLIIERRIFGKWVGSRTFEHNRILFSGFLPFNSYIKGVLALLSVASLES